MNKERGPVELSNKVLEFFTSFPPPDDSVNNHEIAEELEKCWEAHAIITREYHKGRISVLELTLAYGFIADYVNSLYRASYERLKNSNL